jgi:hypothetical protein
MGGEDVCVHYVVERADLLFCFERVKRCALCSMKGTCACPGWKGFLFTGLDLLGCIFFSGMKWETLTPIPVW